MNTLTIALPISKPVAFRAAKVAIIVGIILAFINYGNLLISGNITTECWIKMILTCLVPYTVSCITATMNIMEHQHSN